MSDKTKYYLCTILLLIISGGLTILWTFFYPAAGWYLTYPALATFLLLITQNIMLWASKWFSPTLRKRVNKQFIVKTFYVLFIISMVAGMYYYFAWRMGLSSKDFDTVGSAISALWVVGIFLPPWIMLEFVRVQERKWYEPFTILLISMGAALIIFICFCIGLAIALN